MDSGDILQLQSTGVKRTTVLQLMLQNFVSLQAKIITQYMMYQIIHATKAVTNVHNVIDVYKGEGSRRVKICPVY